MGTVVSKAADGVGAFLGNAFSAPFKSMFGGSCEGICSGTWDVMCFIEHFCVSNLIKLLMVLVLCYITLLFFYLLFKVGMLQCIGRSLCKMCWAACETYFFALEDITCFLWHKLKNTKRVYRGQKRLRRRRYPEIAGSSSSDVSTSLEDGSQSLSVGRKRKSDREGRNYQNCLSHHQHVRLKTRDVSVHVKGRSQGARNSRRQHLRNVSNVRREAAISKRRRIR